jgi:hypothetical protein
MSTIRKIDLKTFYYLGGIIVLCLLPSTSM